MGYCAAIAKVASISGLNRGVEEKLKKAAGLMVKTFPFEQCAIYLWDEDEGIFNLKALGGVKRGGGRSYREGEGLPWAAKKKKNLIEFHLSGAGARGFNDSFLEGFKSAIVCPLGESGSFYGAIYLKSVKRTALGKEAKEALISIASLLANVIRHGNLEKDLNAAWAELREIKKRLLDAEKSMALGDMAAALAHDIRNPILSIGGFAGKLKTILGPGSQGILFVENIVKETERLEGLINGILAVLRGSPLKPELIDVNYVIEDSLRDFFEEFRTHGIKVARNLSPIPLNAMAEGPLLKIAFDNIISNAIQSMEKGKAGGADKGAAKGGTLRVTTSLEREWVFVSIADTGGGIDPGHLPRIFDPFFTTREGGIGMGLPITNSIVTRHGGSVNVANNPGVGATFTVKLPYTAVT